MSFEPKPQGISSGLGGSSGGLGSGAKITHQEIIDGFKESMGEEGADHLLREALQKLSMFKQTDYTKAQALKICRELNARPGMVGLIAGILMARFKLR